jgi:hypothetical protein
MWVQVIPAENSEVGQVTGQNSTRCYAQIAQSHAPTGRTAAVATSVLESDRLAYNTQNRTWYYLSVMKAGWRRRPLVLGDRYEHNDNGGTKEKVGNSKDSS